MGRTGLIVLYPINNNGTQDEAYDLDCSYSGAVTDCQLDSAFIHVGAGESAVITATYATSTTAGGGGLVFTVNSSTDQATAVTNITVVPPPVVQVNPQGELVTTAIASHSNVQQFTVQISGEDTLDYTLTAHCSDGATNCALSPSQPNPVTIAPGDTQVVEVSYDAGAPGTLERVSLTATSESLLGTSTGTGFVDVMPSNTYAVVVSPDQDRVVAVPGSSSAIVMFVHNTGTVTTQYHLSADCTGPVFPASGCSVISPDPELAADSVAQVFIFWGPTSSTDADSGQLTLTATQEDPIGEVSAEASMTIVAHAGHQDTARVDVASVNPGATLDRQLCLSAAAGNGASWQCGDLSIAHALPSTKTMNRLRTPVLIYNSQLAQPHPVVAALVTIGDSVKQPDSVKATLTISSTNTIKQWTGRFFSPGRTARIAISFDAENVPTGVYPYTLTVSNIYNSPRAVLPASSTGKLIIVNRSKSPFGAGWWLAGYEHLVSVSSDSSSLLWVGGDGSARIYSRVTTGVWAAPNVDRPDTLKQGGAGFVRYLLHGARVRFDGQFRHVATINRQGDSTVFTSDGSSIALSSISLPVPDGAPVKEYLFNYYQDTLLHLQSVVAPPLGPQGDTVRHVVLDSATQRRVASITDPDGTKVAFKYDPTDEKLIVADTGKRGEVTSFAYDEAKRLTSTSLDMGAAGAITTHYRNLDSLALSTSPSATGADSSYVVINGPRTDTTVTRFWLDRFGAPRRIVDALGYETALYRGSTQWPALVTRVEYPSGQVDSSTYDERGHVSTVSDLTTIIDGENPTTSYEWDMTWDAISKITNPEGDSSTFDYDLSTGNLLHQRDGRGDSTEVSFGYNSDNQVISVTSPGTPAELVYYEDQLGNVDSSKTPKGYRTDYENDAVGRVTLISSPIDTLATSTRRQEQRFYYDIMDRDTLTVSYGPAMTDSVPAEEIHVWKHFNVNGQVDTLKRWAEPNAANVGTITTKWVYDIAGRVVAEIAPDSATDSTYYDAAGNVRLSVTRRGFGIPSRYDALNRLVARTIPLAQDSARQAGITSKVAPFLPASFPAYETPEDNQIFTYDGMGRLLIALNKDARIKRSYYTNGLLETDSLWIRPVEGWDPTKHVYGIHHRYDLDGRQVALGIPAQLGTSGDTVITFGYDPKFGALTAVTDLENATYGFGYTARQELRTINYPGLYQQTLAYDADGRTVAETVLNLGGTSYPRFGMDTLRSMGYGYDARGKLLSSSDPMAYRDTLTLAYSGLGHVVESIFSEHDKAPNCGDSTRAYMRETFKYDALGNRTTEGDTTDISSSLKCANSSSGGHSATYATGTGRLVEDAVRSGGERTDVSYHHNEAGDVDFAQGLGTPAQEKVLYYGADGKLSAVDSRHGDGAIVNFGSWTRAFDEYRYDALGRRIWVRSQKSCRDDGMANFVVATECKTSILRRVIWDGDQILAEIQMPGDSSTRDVPYWENDTAAVRLPTLSTSSGTGDPSRYFGRVVYAHAGGVDHPISITRYNYAYAKDDSEHVVSPTAVIPRATVMPFWDALGNATLGAFTTGGAKFCTPSTSQTQCEGVFWPYLFSAYNRQTGAAGRTNWQGSLLESGQDKSGMEFKRDRYYDPQTGRFTQEDPIGLAGGLNLYGYAGGDPVNASDPFGLCPDSTADGTLCIDLFIQAEKAWGFRGDNRDFDADADASRSRLQVTYKPGDKNGTVITTGSCNPFKCFAPYKSNKVSISVAKDGSITVKYKAEDSAAYGLALELNGTVTFTSDGQGGWNTSGNRDNYPNIGIYLRKNGKWTVLTQRPGAQDFFGPARMAAPWRNDKW